eukprot:TRINITY_DN15210_c1_g1_i1.p1 TRINITY_DN15210_c1_g1~~TRINITY_DN15210_c1_g1_i1.p1  ORF type:complete len:513 (-),score=128.83 TRINITY_DN15210_c1_g1_i1:44-1582(-)
MLDEAVMRKEESPEKECTKSGNASLPKDSSFKSKERCSDVSAKKASDYSEEELQELLDDRERWTIFEDAEDEVYYLRRRGDVLAHALIEARAEISHLHKAGVRLQDAFESLQLEFREVAGEIVYWKALAEAREEELKSWKENVPSNTKILQASNFKEKETVQEEDERIASKEVDRKVSDEILEKELDPREALRLAAAEAARWRQLAEQRGEDNAQLRRTSTTSASIVIEKPFVAQTPKYQKAGAGGVAPPLPTFGSSEKRSVPLIKPSVPVKGNASGAAETLIYEDSNMARTPPRPPSSDAGSFSPSESMFSCRSVSSDCGSTKSSKSQLQANSMSVSSVASASSTSSAGRKWGIGSSPKRCPGLGTPSRKVAPKGSVSSSPASIARPKGSERYRDVTPPSTSRRSAAPVEKGGGTRKIAALVNLWEAKKSPDKTSSRGAAPLAVASPMKALAAQQQFQVEASNAETSSIVKDLAGKLNIVPEELDKAWSRPGSAPSSRTLDVWLRYANLDK